MCTHAILSVRESQTASADCIGALRGLHKIKKWNFFFTAALLSLSAERTGNRQSVNVGLLSGCLSYVCCLDKQPSLPPPFLGPGAGPPGRSDWLKDVYSHGE